MFSENKLIMIEKDKLIAQIAENDPKLKVAVFDTFPLNTQDIKDIVKALKNNNNLLALKLLDCQITAEHIEILKPGIEANKSLIEVVIEKFINDNEKTISAINAIKTHVDENKKNSVDSSIEFKHVR